MKYFIFFCGLFFVVPAGTLAASYSRRVREVVFSLLVFSTAFTDWYDINFVERWWYAGTTRGIEVSFVDLLALILVFSTLLTLRRDGYRLYWPASLGLMLVYIAYGALTVLALEPRLFGLFELSKLFRGLLVFLAVAWYIRTPRDMQALLWGLGAALVCNGALTVWQRYTGLAYRVQGSFPHPNALGGYCVLAAPVLLATAFLPFPKWLRLFGGLAWTGAAVATILTISRMAAATFLVASVGTMFAAQGLRLNLQKLAIAVVMGILAVGLFYRGADRFITRQEAKSGTSGDILRTDHYKMGLAMASDHVFGVGLNNWPWRYYEYCYVGEVVGGNAYESTSDPGAGGATLAHTLYGLTLGELGWPGLALLCGLFLQWLYLSGSLVLARPPSLSSGIGAACFWGFLGLFAANTTDSIFRWQHIFILSNLLLGFVVAARRQGNSSFAGGGRRSQ